MFHTEKQIPMLSKTSLIVIRVAELDAYFEDRQKGGTNRQSRRGVYRVTRQLKRIRTLIVCFGTLSILVCKVIDKIVS